MNTTRTTLGLFGILILTATAACTAESDEQESNEAAVTELKSYWADAKKLDLGDLTRVTVGYATDGLNGQLASPNLQARFEAPTVFAASAQPNKVLPDGSEIKALDTVVTGLAARFGEKELGTEVNSTRLAHLARGADKYYVESAFATRAGIDHGWSHAAKGFGGSESTVNLGFDAGAELSSRVIVATSDDKVGSLVKAPLAATKEMRGFVVPRSVDDVRKMKPGTVIMDLAVTGPASTPSFTRQPWRVAAVCNSSACARSSRPHSPHSNSSRPPIKKSTPCTASCWCATVT